MSEPIVSPRSRLALLALCCATVALLSGCGGSGGGDIAPGPPVPNPPPPGQPTDAQRVTAATTTAQTNAACVNIQPFYWEIGDKDAARASGSVTGSAPLPIGANTRLSIASASKWFYSSYYVQKVGGVANLTADDIKFFNFESGYTNFTSCSGDTTPDPTVASCLAVGSNGVKDPNTVDKFDYGGGHMQEHAATIGGLGALNDSALAAEIERLVGTDINVAYSEPQLAGGAIMAASDYAKLLRKVLGNQLKMHDALGTHQVCTNSKNCPGQALSSPAPSGEDWHYSIGHWVEDATNVSDGAYSSPGAFGFYPWIDKTKTYYGVVSRADLGIGSALNSVYCGRLIRKAWVTGTAQ